MNTEELVVSVRDFVLLYTLSMTVIVAIAGHIAKKFEKGEKTL